MIIIKIAVRTTEGAQDTWSPIVIEVLAYCKVDS